MPRTAHQTSQGAPLGPLIRKRRKQLGLTLKQLGESAGLSVGYLSQVERDNAAPSLGTLAQIAEAVDVGLDYFIATPRPADALTREGARPRFSLAHSDLVYEQISHEFPGSELSSYMLHVPAGHVSELVSHEGEEIIVILEGEIEQVLGEETFRMRAGDSLHYSGATPHAWRNPGDRPARILWTGTLGVLHRAGARRADAPPRLPKRHERPQMGE